MGIIIRKSRGNWFWKNGANALLPSRHTLEELGLNHPDINPFHTDPETFERFDETEHQLKEAFDGLVDEMAKEIMDSGLISDPGKAKMQARKDINEATKRFNKMKELAGDMKNRLPIPYKNPATGELDPAYTKATYTPEWQAHAKWEGPGQYNDKKDPKTGFQLNEGAELHHPRDRQVRDDDGNVLNISESMRKIKPHGWLTELWQFHQLNQLRDVVHERGYHMPEGALRGGGIEPHVFSPYRRHTMSQDVEGGKFQVDPDDKLHRGADGLGFGMLRALATLHPAFFEERGSQTVADERLPILEHYFPRVSGAVLQRLSRTPVGELLTEEFRMGEKPFRTKRSPGVAVLNKVKLDAGIPNRKEAQRWGKGSEQYQRWAAFNNNSEHMLLIMGADMSDKNRFKLARAPLARSLYASIQARRRGPVGNSTLQTQFMSHFPSVGQIGAHEVQDIAYHPGMEPNLRPPPRTEVPKVPFAPTARDGPQIGAGDREGLVFDQAPTDTGARPLPRDMGSSQLPKDLMYRLSEPMGTVFNIMENLQKADARLDDEVIKSLPGTRKFDLKKSSDKEDLCKAYDLSEVDLHYIEQARGDWSKVAQHLNVDPLVVKSVKVALG